VSVVGLLIYLETRMHMTYSPQVDAFAIRLRRARGHVRTIEVRSGVHLDFDSEDRCVGLELLGASFHCDRADPEQLDRPARGALDARFVDVGHGSATGTTGSVPTAR
jgi:hypothetical protein